MAGLDKHTFGKLTTAEVKKLTTWGNGPSITFNKNLPFDKDLNVGEYAYSPTINSTEISADYAQHLEQILESDASNEDKKAALYEFLGIMAHELVHDGDKLNSTEQEKDPGTEFQQEIFESVDYEENGKTIGIFTGLSIHGDSKDLMGGRNKDIIPTLPEPQKKKDVIKIPGQNANGN